MSRKLGRVFYESAPWLCVMVFCLLPAPGCGSDPEVIGTPDGGEGSSDSDADGDGDSDSDGDGDSDGDADSDDDDDNDEDSCEPSDDFDDFEVDECEEEAPAGSFDPVEEWTWTPETSNKDGLGPPLVVNMTDDNGDGEVNLCDTPDIVVVAGGEDMDVFGLNMVSVPMPIVNVIDGATGTLLFTCDTPVSPYTAPAVGDIDQDGLPEIVVPANLASILENIFNPSGWQGLLAFENDGTLKWATDIGDKLIDIAGSLSISLADLDHDGDVEIISGAGVYDGLTGAQIWSQTNSTVLQLDGLSMASVAADLDGDGLQEVITGTYAFDSQGNVYYDRSDLVTPSTVSLVDFIAGLDDLIGLYPLVANLDDDPEPEVLVAGGQGIFLLEHDGTTKYQFDPSDAEGWFDWDFGGGEFGPATVHDFNGDGLPEIGIGTTEGFIVFDRTLTPIWSTPISAKNVTLGATAFDFLGDGVAEAIYSDEEKMIVFDGQNGDVLMTWPRLAASDYPIVADVDDDESAEIIFVSTQPDTGEVVPTLKVLGDSESRWISTRRVWNQHSYHVTNVIEDGTIPEQEPNSWDVLNTYRTNVQMEGEICDPVGPV